MLVSINGDVLKGGVSFFADHDPQYLIQKRTNYSGFITSAFNTVCVGLEKRTANLFQGYTGGTDMISADWSRQNLLNWSVRSPRLVDRIQSCVQHRVDLCDPLLA